MEKKELLYEGKAKKVFSTEDPDLCIVSYKDDATAFNGEKKGTIVGKGVVNNRMSNFMFKLLEKHGIAPDTVENAGLATQLIERLKMRQQNGLSTPKQIRFLERKGFAHVGTWSFVAASSMIGRIAENDWRIPSGIIPAAYKPQEGMNHEAI